MASRGVAKGLKFTSISHDHNCQGCILGKSVRSVIPKSVDSRSSKLLELVHTDVLGPLEIPSVGGSRYLITFIDDYSRWTVEYAMKSKSDALSCFQRYKAMAEKHTSQKVQKVTVPGSTEREQETSDMLKILRSDNGGEYL